jgi:Mn2+/Fe2+ NRAMP family transporter
MVSQNKKNKRPALGKLIHGLISGAADNDPAGISTYSIVGATTGLSQLWLVIVSTPLLINIQSLCAKIGDVKKQGLAQIIESTYGRKIAVFSLIMLTIANLATLGADFAAIAAGIRLIFPRLNTLFLLPLITIFIWCLIVFRSYRTFSKFLTLLSLVFVSYIVAGFLARPNWSQVLRATLIPQVGHSPNYWLAAVAFLGTTITPFLFYWQVTEEVEDHPSVKDALHEASQNTGGFILSNTVTYFVIVTNASLFFNKGIEINSAVDAAAALTPLAGQFAKLLFAIGIIGSGLLAVPVLAAVTSYAIAETFGWKKGLDYSLRKAKSFYTTLSATFLVGLAIALIGWSPLKALFFSQVINGFLAPFLIFIILMVANNPHVVGKYTASRWQNMLGWITIAIMSAAALGSIIQIN